MRSLSVVRRTVDVECAVGVSHLNVCCECKRNVVAVLVLRGNRRACSCVWRCSHDGVNTEIQEQLAGDQLLRYNGITGKFSEVDARELDEAIDSSLAMSDELAGQYDLAAAFQRQVNAFFRRTEIE